MTAHVPRAGLDPIDTPETALALIGRLLDDATSHRTFVLLVDHRSLGAVVAVVDHDDPPGRPGTPPPDWHCDEVIEVARVFASAAAASSQRQLIIASIRPGEAHHDGDAERWVRLSAVVNDAGAHLREWFVIGVDGAGIRGVGYPRRAAGEPTRWPS